MLRPSKHHNRLSIHQKEAKLVFNKTLAGCYQQGIGEYKNVEALLLMWEDDDLGCSIEIDMLRKLFEDKFNFTTRTYKIPSLKSASSLQLEVAKFVNDNDSPDSLVIVYYGGHGVLGEETGELKIAAKGEADSNGDPKVFFNEILKSLRVIDCDVLVIVDSCFAGRAYYPEEIGMRKFELLTASSDSEETKGPSQSDSFTTLMIKKIEDMLESSLHARGFAVSSLFRALYHDKKIFCKPLLFDMSHRDYGKLWLRPRPKESSLSSPEALTTLNLTLHIAHQTNDYVIHEIARGLQYLKNVQKIELNELNAPDWVVIEFVRSVRMATIIRNWYRAFLKRKQKKSLEEAKKTEETPTVQEAAQLINRKVERRESSFYDWTNSTYFIDGEWKPVKKKTFSQAVDAVVQERPEMPISPKNLLSFLSTALTLDFQLVSNLAKIIFPVGGPTSIGASDDIVVEGQTTPGGSKIVRGHSQRTYPANPTDIMDGSIINLDYDWELRVSQDHHTQHLFC